MARSVLGSFVSGTRQMLAIQLVISIAAVGLAGWTLGVTNDLIRERNRLNDRVRQLEETLVANNIVVPSTVTVVDPPRQQPTAYPPSVTLPEQPPAPAPETPAPEQRDPRSEDGPPQQPQPETPTTPTPQPPPAADGPRFDPNIIIDLFRPAPPLRNVVLHVRSEADLAAAQGIATEISRASGIQVTVVVMPPRDPRQSGYSYFDGRQSRAAANFMQQFHDAARRRQVAAWSAQLRGVALPAQGEYTTDRLDVVLPPIPTGPVGPAIDPRRFRETPPVVQQGPVIR